MDTNVMPEYTSVEHPLLEYSHFHRKIVSLQKQPDKKI